jgi:hypothetical protein
MRNVDARHLVRNSCSSLEREQSKVFKLELSLEQISPGLYIPIRLNAVQIQFSVIGHMEPHTVLLSPNNALQFPLHDTFTKLIIYKIS